MKQKRETILEWYRKRQHYIDAPCGGRGDCGRCKVKFVSKAPEAGEKDRKCLSAEEIAQGVRLACATEKTDDAVFLLAGDIFEEGIQKLSVKSEFEKDAEEESEQFFGIALDVGTTTIAIRLVSLKTGRNIETLTMMNHQRAYGADVLSRIQAANQGKLRELQMCIQQDIYELLTELLNVTGIRSKQIKCITVAGNTTMCHLLLGYSCEGLGRAPFTPVNIAFIKIKARELFGELYSEIWTKSVLNELEAEVVILPGISAFVGADIVAGMYFCDMDLKEEPCMLLDVGTNGEMAVGNSQGFFVTSTAAGPVFEGGNISCGMPAVKGAVAHIKADGYEVIGNAEPQGLCGSGLVDLAALMQKNCTIDENGTFSEEYFESGYPLMAGQEKLKLTQADMRELQMGKAAIRAGMEALIREQRPEEIYLAGGFGAAIDVSSACRIGLFPEEYEKRIISRGNTALEGAHKFLLDEKGEERLQKIVQDSKEITLAESAEFEENYIQFMQFLI